MMQRIKSARLVTPVITAVLLFSFAFTASAEQIMKALPAPAAAQPIAAPAAMQQPIAAPAAMQPMAAPPAAQPAVVAPMPQMKLAPPSQGRGMAQLTPAAACGLNTTPRISNINGTQFSIVFKPGDSLNITGCGFGNGGQAYLSSGGTTVPLKIDTWSNENIHAHLINSLSGIPDLGSVKVNIQPAGGTVIGSTETNSFLARRETRTVTTNLSHYVKFQSGGANVSSSFLVNASTNQWGPVVMDQYGTVARVTTGVAETAFADDLFTLLDPGMGFKTTKLNVTWLTKELNNGSSDPYNIIRYRGGNSSKLLKSGPDVYEVTAGEQYIRNKNAPELPPICKGIDYCHYSKYQVSVDVTGPAGVPPP